MWNCFIFGILPNFFINSTKKLEANHVFFPSNMLLVAKIHTTVLCVDTALVYTYVPSWVSLDHFQYNWYFRWLRVPLRPLLYDLKFVEEANLLINWALSQEIHSLQTSSCMLLCAHPWDQHSLCCPIVLHSCSSPSPNKVQVKVLSSLWHTE